MDECSYDTISKIFVHMHNNKYKETKTNYIKDVFKRNNTNDSHKPEGEASSAGDDDSEMMLRNTSLTAILMTRGKYFVNCCLDFMFSYKRPKLV